MKHLTTYKIFENNYVKDDIILIRYWATEEPVEVRVKEEKSGNKLLVSFDVPGSVIQNAPDQVISKGQIISKIKGVDSPAEPNDEFKISAQKISNDLVINNYPKTI